MDLVKEWTKIQKHYNRLHCQTNFSDVVYDANRVWCCLSELVNGTTALCLRVTDGLTHPQSVILPLLMWVTVSLGSSSSLCLSSLLSPVTLSLPLPRPPCVCSVRCLPPDSRILVNSVSSKPAVTACPWVVVLRGDDDRGSCTSWSQQVKLVCTHSSGLHMMRTQNHCGKPVWVTCREWDVLATMLSFIHRALRTGLNSEAAGDTKEVYKEMTSQRAWTDNVKYRP